MQCVSCPKYFLVQKSTPIQPFFLMVMMMMMIIKLLASKLSFLLLKSFNSFSNWEKKEFQVEDDATAVMFCSVAVALSKVGNGVYSRKQWETKRESLTKSGCSSHIIIIIRHNINIMEDYSWMGNEKHGIITMWKIWWGVFAIIIIIIITFAFYSYNNNKE